MELPQAEPPRCLQAHWVGVTEDVSRLHQPANRELLMYHAAL
jgi:hypothetical protein